MARSLMVTTKAVSPMSSNNRLASRERERLRAGSVVNSRRRVVDGRTPGSGTGHGHRQPSGSPCSARPGTRPAIGSRTAVDAAGASPWSAIPCPPDPRRPVALREPVQPIPRADLYVDQQRGARRQWHSPAACAPDPDTCSQLSNTRRTRSDPIAAPSCSVCATPLRPSPSATAPNDTIEVDRGGQRNPRHLKLVAGRGPPRHLDRQPCLAGATDTTDRDDPRCAEQQRELRTLTLSSDEPGEIGGQRIAEQLSIDRHETPPATLPFRSGPR